MFNPELTNGRHEGGVERNEGILESLRGFIRENKMNAKQVEDAYFGCIDGEVNGFEEAIPGDLVMGLAKRFVDAEQEGIALNAIGVIVSEMEKHAAAPEHLLAYINGLPVDNRSRKSLISIFEMNRTGELQFLDPKTLEYIIPRSMRLPAVFKDLSKEERAEQLLDVLSLFVKHIGERNFGIEFSEEG